MNVDEMEAGPELNARVAERFRGEASYAPFSSEKGGAFNYVGGLEAVRAVCEDLTRRKGGRWEPRYDGPDYSGHIAAAWPLVERVKGEWHDEIRLEHSGCPTELWDCLIFSKEGQMLAREAGETAPLAICRAFLKASTSRSASA